MTVSKLLTVLIIPATTATTATAPFATREGAEPTIVQPLLRL